VRLAQWVSLAIIPEFLQRECAMKITNIVTTIITVAVISIASVTRLSRRAANGLAQRRTGIIAGTSHIARQRNRSYKTHKSVRKIAQMAERVGVKATIPSYSASKKAECC
jgi:hypothetical protein